VTGPLRCGVNHGDGIRDCHRSAVALHTHYSVHHWHVQNRFSGAVYSSWPSTCPTSTVRFDPQRAQMRPGGGLAFVRYLNARSVTGPSFRRACRRRVVSWGLRRLLPLLERSRQGRVSPSRRPPRRRRNHHRRLRHRPPCRQFASSSSSVSSSSSSPQRIVRVSPTAAARSPRVVSGNYASASVSIAESICSCRSALVGPVVRSSMVVSSFLSWLGEAPGARGGLKKHFDLARTSNLSIRNPSAPSFQPLFRHLRAIRLYHMRKLCDVPMFH
jgi:hypothetical protein